MERSDRSIFGQGKVHEVMLRSVKPLLRVLLKLILQKLPEPNKQNTVLANSHTLIDLRDKFFSLDKCTPRVQELRALWNIFIAIYDYDMLYRERFDWAFNQLKQVVWRSSDGRREPRKPWWGENVDVCPNCGQDKGSRRVFANCPIGMHSD